jgi:hypothetical protein
VTLADVTVANGIMGGGTVKNTDGANSLTVKESVTDLFGVSASVETVIPASYTYLLETLVNVDPGRPPYSNYKVEIKSTTPGNAATYDWFFSSMSAP